MKNRRDETYVQRLLGSIFTITGAVFLIASVMVQFLIYGDISVSPTLWDKSPFIVSIVFFQLGLPFFLLGTAFSLWAIMRRRRITRLIAEGDRITADIEYIVPNFNARINAQFPHKLLCSWYDARADVTYHFRSGNLWGNPGLALKERGIKTVTVYVDRANMRKYYVAVPGFENRDIYL